MGLPAERRLRRGSDITAVVRRGSRARAGGLVVHASRRDTVDVVDGGPGPSAVTGPVRGVRVAFVAPRTVGPAVLRNRTRRRVQEQLRTLVDRGWLVRDVDLVVRLLPAATTAGSPELYRQLRASLGRLGVLDDGRS